MQPTVTREADSWRFDWSEYQLAARVDFLREDDTGFWVELHVSSTLGLEHTHLHRGRLNLVVSDSKTKLAALLAKKIASFQWDTALEYLAEKVLADYRGGAPLVRLDELDDSADSRDLIAGFLPFGEPTVLFSDGGSGKSAFALSCACAVASGVTMAAHLAPLQTGPVLYCDWETSAPEQRERLGALARGRNLVVPPVYYRSLYRPLTDEIKRLREEVARLGIIFVVIDSIAPACGGEPEKADVILTFFNALRAFGPNVTKLVVSHVSKAAASQTGGNGSPFGSIFVRNMARSVWEMRKSEGEGDGITVGLFHRKVNRGTLRRPFGLDLRFATDPRGHLDSLDIVHYDLRGDPDLLQHASLSYRIRATLATGARSIDNLAEELDATPTAVRGLLQKMSGVHKATAGASGLGSGFWALDDRATFF